MKVGIDISGLAWKYRTGVQNFYYGLIEGLADELGPASPVECWLVDRSGKEGDEDLGYLGRLPLRQAAVPRILPRLNLPASSPSPLRLWNRAARKIDRVVAARRRVNRQLLDDLDVFHVWVWDAQSAPRARHVITLHDLIPILFAQFTPKGFTRATQAGLQFAKRHADCIVADSLFTKEELVRVGNLAAERIRVIYPGVRPIFRPLERTTCGAAVRAKYGIHDRPYVLSAGFLDPRKNIKGHVRAFERIAQEQEMRDLQLVLVGPESPATPQVLADIASARVRDRIHVTGYVSDDDLVALMNGAQLFAYCSVYEGFGFPVLEAMACGTPVVTSNTTSLAEISRDAAILVDPANHDEIASGMERLLTDDRLRNTMRTRGLMHVRQFTWRKCAQEYLHAYQDCCGSGAG